MKKRDLQGSYTVEVALIMPFLTAILICLLSLTLFLHDKVSMLALLNQCLTRAEVLACREMDWDSGEILYEANISRGPLYLLESKDEQAKKLEKYIWTTVEDRYWFLVKLDRIEVEMNMKDITISLYPSMKNDMLAKLFLPEQKWSKTFDIHRPAELMRAFGNVADKLSEESGDLDLSLNEKLETAQDALSKE